MTHHSFLGSPNFTLKNFDYGDRNMGGNTESGTVPSVCKVSELLFHVRVSNAAVAGVRDSSVCTVPLRSPFIPCSHSSKGTHNRTACPSLLPGSVWRTQPLSFALLSSTHHHDYYPASQSATLSLSPLSCGSSPRSHSVGNNMSGHNDHI